MNSTPPKKLSRAELNMLYHRIAVDYEAMRSEQHRLASFYAPVAWPVKFIQPTELAKSGFFFLQDMDKVQCAFCRNIAGLWMQGDKPMEQHKKHFPRCPFVCGAPTGNIPILTGQACHARRDYANHFRLLCDKFHFKLQNKHK